jgi:hypothetical protein
MTRVDTWVRFKNFLSRAPLYESGDYVLGDLTVVSAVVLVVLILFYTLKENLYVNVIYFIRNCETGYYKRWSKILVEDQLYFVNS